MAADKRSKKGNNDAGRVKVVVSTTIGGSAADRGRLAQIMNLRVSPQAVAGICTVCLLLVVSWLWLEMRQRFPNIAPGGYIGEMTGVLGAEKVPFYLESVSGGDVFVGVLKKGWGEPDYSPQPIALAAPEGGSAEWRLPLGVSGPQRSVLIFTGAPDEGGYSGVVKAHNGGKGEWRLRPLSMEGGGSDIDSAELDLLLRLKSELAHYGGRISALEQRIPKQKQEIEQLTEFITEGDDLRARADRKYLELKSKLQEARNLLKERQGEAQGLERQLEISQRVTKMGQLVSLARKSLEREWRWMESMLRSTGPILDDDLESAVERAERIVAVKEEIALERERIFRLQQLLESGRRVR